MPSKTTLVNIKKQTQRIARLELQLAKLKSRARRLDTHNKILLGGLVIKAKLHVLSLDDLLLALFSIEADLQNEPTLLDVFRAKGEAVFLGHLIVWPLRMCHAVEPECMSYGPGTAEFFATLKKATRHKIQMGGIILKTQLALLSKAQLLGALVWLNEKLQRGH